MDEGCATKEPGVLVGGFAAQTLLLRTLEVPSYHLTEPPIVFLSSVIDF